MSLRDRQIAALEQMLNLNSNHGEMDLTSLTNQEEIIWKVLILDAKSTGVVSSVLRVNDLLRCGITIHLMINAKRSPLPDVPLIYFVEPTLENVKLIINDVNADLYSAFYINFTSSISRTVLEEFAKEISLTGKADRIKKMFDQYTDFIVTEPNLFSLDFPRVYSQLNDPKIDEQQVELMIDGIATGIAHCLITLNQIPIIRCPKNGPAEMVAIKLEQKLRDYVLSIKTHHNIDSLQRSVLILLDRNFDLAAMFAHSWIYQCLVSDIFKLQRNTITIESHDSHGETSKEHFDIDPKDYFWSKNALALFPDAADDVDLELTKYKQEAENLTLKTGYSSLSDIDPNSTTDTAHIQQAINLLPALTAKKTIVDMHMKVLSLLLKELEARKLNLFLEIEQEFNDPTLKEDFLNVLDQKLDHDNANDKLRTFLILILFNDFSKDYIQQVETKLKLSGIEDLSAINYILRVKEVTSLKYLSNATQNSSASNQTSFNGVASKLFGLAEGRISEGFTTMMKKFKVNKNQMPITNIVESIMDPINSKNVALTDDYLFFDPRATRGTHSQRPKRQSYNESIVFVVGGGNYLEYSNLQEWVVLKNVTNNSKSIIYGSTDIITPNDFLKECQELGKF